MNFFTIKNTAGFRCLFWIVLTTGSAYVDCVECRFWFKEMSWKRHWIFFLSVIMRFSTTVISLSHNKCSVHCISWGSAEKQVQRWNSMARLLLEERLWGEVGQEPGPAESSQVGWQGWSQVPAGITMQLIKYWLNLQTKERAKPWWDSITREWWCTNKWIHEKDNKRENLKRLGKKKWLLKHFWSNQIWVRLPGKFRGDLLIFSIILCFYYGHNVSAF